MNLTLHSTLNTCPSGRRVYYFSFKIPYPKLDEQKKIANFLDNEVAKIDSLIEMGDKQIQLMQERRTALISAAVTGKIDVRDWVKPE